MFSWRRIAVDWVTRELPLFDSSYEQFIRNIIYDLLAYFYIKITYQKNSLKTIFIICFSSLIHFYFTMMLLLTEILYNIFINEIYKKKNLQNFLKFNLILFISLFAVIYAVVYFLVHGIWLHHVPVHYERYHAHRKHCLAVQWDAWQYFSDNTHII